MNYNKKNIKAVIFDMDGLMLNSEAVCLQTFREVCLEKNFEPDISVYMKCIGTISSRTWEILQEGYGPTFPLAEIKLLWKKRYNDKIENNLIPLKPGINKLLDFLTATGRPLGVATSTARVTTEKKLNNTGLLGYFRNIICGDEVEYGKPAPEIYLKAAKMMEVAPVHCLVLEDSDNGIKAAVAAKTNPIQVPDLKPPGRDVLDFKHLIINTLEEVLHFLECKWI